MRICSFVAVAALTLSVVSGGSVVGMAQVNTGSTHKSVFGYKDSVTGEFKPMAHATPDATAAPLTGEIELTITVTLKTPVPSGGSVLCTTEVSAISVGESTGAETDYIEQASAVAKVSGTTATCTVNTPYSWLLAQSSTTVEDSLGGSYTVTILPAPSASINYASLVGGRSSSSQFLTATKLPASGTVSKYTIAATL